MHQLLYAIHAYTSSERTSPLALEACYKHVSHTGVDASSKDGGAIWEGDSITVIKPKFASTPNCSPPKCEVDLLARAKKRSPGVVTHKAVPEKEGALSRDRYMPGDCVFADQFSVKTPGRLEHFLEDIRKQYNRRID